MKSSAQLTLIEMPGKESPAVKPEKIPTVQPWVNKYVGYFWCTFKTVTGKEPALGYGALKKMLQNYADKNWIEPTTGEIEIPSYESWKEETDYFFQDEFAAKERGFHFSYLLKQFGSFKKYEPAKKRTAETDAMIIYMCTKCGRAMANLRSYWTQFKNRSGTCVRCGTRFNVNDVLNQIPSIENFLPPQQEQQQ
jgi:DNA-directed RNA polymerase subunit RPC12/RpoP